MRSLTSRLLLALVLVPFGTACAVCGEPDMTDEDIHQIVTDQRATRDDLPAAFETSTWRVNQDGCYYKYVEFAEPATPGKFRVFTLNRHGQIVDVLSANR